MMSAEQSNILLTVISWFPVGTLIWWVAFLTIFALCLLFIPLGIFLTRGWKVKWNEFETQFDPETISLYFNRYRSAEKSVDGKAPLGEIAKGSAEARSREFRNLYNFEFGRSRYISPLILLFFVTLIEAAGVIQSGLFRAKSAELLLQLCHCGASNATCVLAPAVQEKLAALHSELFSGTLLLDATTVAGLIGAYMWVVQDAIARMRSRDLLPSNVFWSALRMAIAAPMGLAIASAASPSIGPFVAFGIGAFPIEQIQRTLRTLTNKQLNVTDDPDTDGDEVKKLVGVNNDVSQRLIAESSSTVLQLAKADPIRLTMRTNLPLGVIAELIDQAIVWLNFASAKADDTAKKMEFLRASNLASATRVAQFMASLAPPFDANAQPQPKSLLTVTATTLSYDPIQLHQILASIAEDEGTLFLVALSTQPPNP